MLGSWKILVYECEIATEVISSLVLGWAIDLWQSDFLLCSEQDSHSMNAWRGSIAKKYGGLSLGGTRWKHRKRSSKQSNAILFSFYQRCRHGHVTLDGENGSMFLGIIFLGIQRRGFSSYQWQVFGKSVSLQESGFWLDNPWDASDW